MADAAGMDACLHLDSGTMLFADATREAARLGDRGLAVTAHPEFGVCGHFVLDREALRRFFARTLDLFARPSASALEASPMAEAVWRRRGGYVTDMSALAEFRALEPQTVADLSKVRDGCVYDVSWPPRRGL
jgi:hypothetical protein